MSVLDALFDTSPEAKMAKKLGITKKALETMFNEYDKDGSGGLDASELQTLAASIGIMWDASQVEEAVTAIDTDGNGVIDITEFATWFCQQPDGGDEPSEMLKMSLQAKIFIRMITNALKDVRDEGGEECKNQAGFQVGDVDVETSRGLFKMYACGSTTEEFAALNPPEDAAAAVYADFSLRDGASEEDIQKIIDGANEGWTMFAEPLLDEIPKPPQVPGMKDGQPFTGKRIEKVTADDGEDVLRFIIFTGVDPSSMWKDSGLDAGEFIPSLHHAQYFNYKLGDIFDAEGPSSLKDWVGGRAEYNFTWNTKTLKAIAAVMNTDFVKNNMGKKKQRYAVSLLARAFRSQNSSFEIAFNGFQDCAEAAIINGAMTAFEMEQARRCDDGEDPWAMIGGRPSEEAISNLIAAVGNLSGKTFSAIRSDLLGCGPIFPKPGYGNHGIYMSPLYMIKEGLSMVPPDFEEYKQLALTFLTTVSGIKAASGCSGFAKMGLEARGMDFLTLLPSPEEIEAASMVNLEDDPEAMLTHYLEHGNIYTRLAMQEAAIAAEEGMLPIPPPFVEKLKEVSVEEGEWEAKKEQYSEVIDIIKAAWAIGKDAVPPGVPPPMVEKAKSIPKKLFGLD
jgi:hypothetical protein